MKTKKFKLFSFLLLKNKVFPFFSLINYKKTTFLAFDLFVRNLKLFFGFKLISLKLLAFLKIKHVVINPIFIKLFKQERSYPITKWKPGFLTNLEQNGSKLVKNLSFVFYNQNLFEMVGVRETRKLKLLFIQFQTFQKHLNQRKIDYCIFYNPANLRAVWFSKKTMSLLFN